MRDGTTDPDDGELGDHPLTVSSDDDLLDQAAEELLAIAMAGSRCGPDRLQVGASPFQPGPFVCSEWIRTVGHEARQVSFTLGKFAQVLFPAPLQRACYQTILRLDAIELPPGAFGLELRLLDHQLALHPLCLPAPLSLLERRQSGFKTRRGECRQKYLGDALVKTNTTQALASALGGMESVGLVARIAANVATCAGVGDLR